MKTKPTQNSGQIANLRPFKPGQSGNPGGRPNTAKLAALTRAFLAETTGGKTRLRQVLEWLQTHDPKMLLYYAYGKPTETVDMQVEKTTIAGLPEAYLAQFREHAQRL